MGGATISYGNFLKDFAYLTQDDEGVYYINFIKEILKQDEDLLRLEKCIANGLNHSSEKVRAKYEWLNMQKKIFNKTK